MANSQSEANKVLRVIEGKTLKYTVRIHHKDGRILEFQSDHTPDVSWDSDLRKPWIKVKVGDGYDTSPVCAWEDGDIILTEANPKP